MKRTIAICCALLIAAAPILACPPRTVYRQAYRAVAVTPVAVVTPVVVAAPVVLVPTYSVSYGAVQPVVAVQPAVAVQPGGVAPQAQQQAIPPTQQQAAPKAQAAPQAVPTEDALKTFANAIGTRCASCHSAAVADSKGAGFVLVTADNKVPALSALERQAILGRIKSENPKRKMPPDGSPALTPQEQTAFNDVLNPTKN